MPTEIKTFDNSFLLHTCCAPCCCAIIEQLLSESIRPVIFFYNPNVQPFDEYLQRKASVIVYVRKKGLDMIDADYDPERWLEGIKGLEMEPERGKRCSRCFDIRLEMTARFAHEHHYRYFATTNGISRWKDLEQVNASGRKAAMPFPGLTFLDRNWRANNAQSAAARISKEENFYQQNYCGCSFSKKLVSP